MEKEITIESAKQMLNTIVLETTAKGELIVNSIQSINYLYAKAKEAEILKAKVTELETLLKAKE